MELISQGNQSSKNETQVSSSKRTHTFLIVPNYTWGKLHALISEKKSEVSGDVSLFELLRPIPDMYLSDVENDEYINKENRDIGDVAVVMVDGLMHDTKRSIWIAKNWGCDLPDKIEYIAPGGKLDIKSLFPDATEDFISKSNMELEKAYTRLVCSKSEVGFIYISSNGIPTTFFEYLCDTLNSNFEFMAINSSELKENNLKYFDIVTMGGVSDWGLSIRRKPLTFENYSASSIFIRLLLLALVLYLIYSYIVGA